jgi:hypothetical protein
VTSDHALTISALLPSISFFKGTLYGVYHIVQMRVWSLHVYGLKPREARARAQRARRDFTLAEKKWLLSF